MRLRLFLAAWFLSLTVGLAAQDKAVEPVFGDGEQLTFTVGYSAKLVSADAGEVVLRATKTTLHNAPVWQIYGNATTYTFFRWFYELNDTYTSWLDEKTLRPVEFSGDVREGKYRFKSHFRYDWNQMKVFTTFRNMAREKDNHREMPITERSFDALALFYNLRNQDIAEFTPNTPLTLEMVLEDTIRNVKCRYLGRETKKFRGMGTFKTLKFSCQLATTTDVAFEDGSEFFIWVSDDGNKIPLYVETPLRIGRGQIKLTKYKNLKYPLTSKIK